MKFVAVETFRDLDGDLIEAGVTHVSPQADVYRRYPQRFKLARSLRDSSPGITRRGGEARLVDRSRQEQAQRQTRHAVSCAQAPQRPSWLLPEKPESWRL
jgi:hypothetical protein